MMYCLLFLTTLTYVALKAFQQLNVTYDKVWWIPGTCLGMALCEVTSLGTIIKLGTLWAAGPMALGGALGCWGAMYLHRRMRKDRT